MVPAILVILVTLTGALLAGLNLVREKEMGTIEQINVTPIGKFEFLAGKLIPFLIIALAELAFGLVMGKILFRIPILGSLLLLFGVVVVYLILVQSLSLLISTVSNTQQQAMFLIFFFMLIFIMTSGIFTPVESMPVIAQKLDWLNPVFYLMRMIRMILLKGSTLKDILPYILR
jgi:ABC-2 type transport system permease protein